MVLLTLVTPCTTLHKPDVEVKGNTALYFESLPSRWLKNALFCRGRIRRVILHQLTIEKPENNIITSKGCFAPQTRSTSTTTCARDRQGPKLCLCRTKSPAPAAWESKDQEPWLRILGSQLIAFDATKKKRSMKSSRFPAMQRTRNRK